MSCMPNNSNTALTDPPAIIPVPEGADLITTRDEPCIPIIS